MHLQRDNNCATASSYIGPARYKSALNVTWDRSCIASNYLVFKTFSFSSCCGLISGDVWEGFVKFSFCGTQNLSLLRSKTEMEIFAVVVHTFRYLSDILNSLRQLGHTAFDYRSRAPLAGVLENSWGDCCCCVQRQPHKLRKHWQHFPALKKKQKNYILQQTGLQFSSKKWERERVGRKNKPCKQVEIKSGINNNTCTFCSRLVFATKQQRVPTSQDARHR